MIRAESFGGFLSCWRVRVSATATTGVAPEPLDGSGRTGWGVFCVFSGGSFSVVSAGARGCSPRAPGRFGQNRLGGVVPAGVRVCF